MEKNNLYVDTVHEVDGDWLNTWNHLCVLTRLGLSEQMFRRYEISVGEKNSFQKDFLEREGEKCLGIVECETGLKEIKIM